MDESMFFAGLCVRDCYQPIFTFHCCKRIKHLPCQSALHLHLVSPTKYERKSKWAIAEHNNRGLLIWNRKGIPRRMGYCCCSRMSWRNVIEGCTLYRLVAIYISSHTRARRDHGPSALETYCTLGRRRSIRLFAQWLRWLIVRSKKWKWNEQFT